MSGRIRLIIVGGVLVLAAVAALLWFVLLSPRLSEATQLDQRAADLESANLSLLNQYNRTMDLAAQAPQAAAEAERLFAAMPQQAELPLVLEQIVKAATDAGIEPSAVDTITTTIPAPISAPEEKAGIALAQLQLTITARGNRADALDFLDNLQRLDRVMLVTSSRLAEAPEEGARNQQSIQVTGTMFVLQSELPDLVDRVTTLLDEAQATAALAETPAATGP